MFGDAVNLLNLGDFSDEEKELLRTDFTYKKKISKLLKEARQVKLPAPVICLNLTDYSC